MTTMNAVEAATVTAVRLDVDGTARVVELPRTEAEGCGPAMREAIGCRAFDVVALGPGLDMWLDDEGLCVDEPVVNTVATRLARAYGFGFQHYVGTVLFIGNDGEGETVSLTGNQREALLASIRCRAAVVLDAGVTR